MNVAAPLKSHTPLAVIVLFFFATHLIWLRNDTVPPMWDQAYYLYNSDILYHTLTDEGIWPFAVKFSNISKIKAPLISALPVPFYLLFGDRYESARYVNLLFLVLCSCYLFGIGARLAGRSAGLLSVLLLNTCPLIFGLAREVLVEYGLMTLVVAWMYYLLKSDGLAQRRFSWALGIVYGLGMLMKISFILYILFPTLFILIHGTVLSRKLPAGEVKNAGIVLFVGVFIAGTWYFRNLGSVIDFALLAGYSDIAQNYGKGEVFSARTIVSYWQSLVNYGFSAYFFMLAIAVAVFKALPLGKAVNARCLTLRDSLFLALWFGVPLLVFTFAVNKEPHYTAPIYPALALMVSAGLSKLGTGRAKKALLCILLAFPIFNYLYMSFSHTPVSLKANGLILLWNHLGWARPFDKNKWPHEAIVHSIARDASERSDRAPLVTLLFNHPFLNFINLNYYAENQRLPVRFNTNDFYLKESPHELLNKIVRETDYLMTKSGDIGPRFTNSKNSALFELLAQGRMPFDSVDQLPLPDGTDLTIYENSQSRALSLPPGQNDQGEHGPAP